MHNREIWDFERKKLFENYLFVQLAFVKIDLGVGLFKGLLQQNDILLIFFALDKDLFDSAFLLSQDLDGFSVSALFFVQFQFQVTDADFQFANDAFSTNDSIGFDFFKTNREILFNIQTNNDQSLNLLTKNRMFQSSYLDFNLQRFLDSFDLDNAFLFFVQNFNGVFKFDLIQ